jgi:hypothetical protein
MPDYTVLFLALGGIGLLGVIAYVLMFVEHV